MYRGERISLTWSIHVGYLSLVFFEFTIFISCYSSPIQKSEIVRIHTKLVKYGCSVNKIEDDKKKMGLLFSVYLLYLIGCQNVLSISITFYLRSNKTVVIIITSNWSVTNHSNKLNFEVTKIYYNAIKLNHKVCILFSSVETDSVSRLIRY